MRHYVLKRLLLLAPTLLLRSAMAFSLTCLIPDCVAVRTFEEKAYAEDLEALRAKFGLDQPPDYPVVQGVTCWSPRPSRSSICSWM